MQLFRRRHEAFPPAKVGSDRVTRLESRSAGFDNLADGSAFQRFVQCERGHIRFPLIHASAHIRVHRHEQIANEHLLILEWLQCDFRQSSPRWEHLWGVRLSGFRG